MIGQLGSRMLTRFCVAVVACLLAMLAAFMVVRFRRVTKRLNVPGTLIVQTSVAPVSRNDGTGITGESPGEDGKVYAVRSSDLGIAVPFSTKVAGAVGLPNESGLHFADPSIEKLRAECLRRNLAWKIWCDWDEQNGQEKFNASAWPAGTKFYGYIEDGVKPNWIVIDAPSQSAAAHGLWGILHYPANFLPKHRPKSHPECPPEIHGELSGSE